jgi:hypothetical protein
VRRRVLNHACAEDTKTGRLPYEESLGRDSGALTPSIVQLFGSNMSNSTRNSDAMSTVAPESRYGPDTSSESPDVLARRLSEPDLPFEQHTTALRGPALSKNLASSRPAVYTSGPPPLQMVSTPAHAGARTYQGPSAPTQSLPRFSHGPTTHLGASRALLIARPFSEHPDEPSASVRSGADDEIPAGKRPRFEGSYTTESPSSVEQCQFGLSFRVYHAEMDALRTYAAGIGVLPEELVRFLLKNALHSVRKEHIRPYC